MGNKRSRFVQPQIVRLYLADVHKRARHTLIESATPEKPVPPDDLADADAAVAQAEADADWVDVKAELNAGETRAVFTDTVKHMQAGERATIDPQQVGITKLLQYVLAWSFTDADGRVIPFSASALNNLNVESFNEVYAAVDWHDDQVDQRRKERKNAQGIRSASSATS